MSPTGNAGPRPSKSRKVSSLLNQIRWVTQITTALTSAVHLDDVYSVLVSGLVSPTGLGYSSAVLFTFDATGTLAKGRIVAGLSSGEQLEALRTELESEASFLAARRAELQSAALSDPEVGGELRTLELGSQWITLFQRISSDSPESEKLRRMEVPIGARREASAPSTIFDEAATWHFPLCLTKKVCGTKLPAELAGYLPERFVAAPVQTAKGLRALILVDRRLDRRQHAVSVGDLEELEWFVKQGAVAVENAELIADLENAYRALKEVESLKTNFLSIISHELRTPLTAITGFVDLILHEKVGDINPTQRSLLSRVAKNTGHLINMVNDLIEITEIEAEGMREVPLVPVDPLATLYATLPKLEYRRRDKSVEIQPSFDEMPPKIFCDERALERIFFHLLDNAVKFSPSHTPVHVDFKTRGRQLAISIRDKGIGIPRENLQRIFEQFYQVDGTLTRSHEGLGLGLAVTKILVGSTHGQIEVESQVGQGSSFTLLYPLAG